MRITLLLLISLSFQLIYSQNKEIRIHLQGVSAESVLDEIEAQSPYYFLYNEKFVDVDFNTSMHYSGDDVFQILDQLFEGKNISYQVLDNQIILSTRREHERDDNTRAEFRLRGQIITPENDPIPGVTISLMGTNRGTISDENGEFSLLAGQNAHTLKFTFIGRRTRIILIGERKYFEVVMAKSIMDLNEVVVIGYGVQKRQTVTGSVASVSGDDIAYTHQTNLSNSLLGKMAGIKSIQYSGEPGNEESNVTIRGYGNPLVLVDGIERNYTQLDPNEIESITVLKDASAAVYGFKGANGVLLVTTKKGSGDATINYEYNLGLQSPIRYIELTNAYEYALLRNEGFKNLGESIEFTEQQLDKYRSGFGTNWFETVVQDRAPVQSHSINVSGANKKVNYFFSVGYLDQESLLGSSQRFQRYNFRSNISTEIRKELTADFKIAGRYEYSKGSAFMGDGGNDIFRGIAMALPTYPGYANDNPNYLQSLGGQKNPFALVSSDIVGYYRNVWKGIQGQMQLRWDIPLIQGLNARALMAVDQGIVKNRDFSDIWSTYNYNVLSDSYKEVNQRVLGDLRVEYFESLTTTQQYSFNYDRKFGEHDISALILLEAKKTQVEALNGSREFDITEVDQLNAGNNENRDNGGTENATAYAGYVGRINYAFKNKYLFEFSARYDGSYKFNANQRWGFFPAFSSGWRISEEPFFKESFSFVDNLKLRLSTGVLGDDTNASGYQWQSYWNYPNGGFIFDNQNLVNGIAETNIANPDISWYNVYISNMGLDFCLFNGKLSAEIDVFYRRRDGLYGTRELSLPTSFGASLPQENINSDSHRGIDAMLASKFNLNEVAVHVQANVSYSSARDEHYERAQDKNEYLRWRYDLNQRNKALEWGFVHLGQFQSFDEILKAPVQDGQGNTTLLPGDIKYNDFNQDGIINEYDQKPIGRDEIPRLIGGLTTSVKWKNLDLNVFFQGGAGYSYETYTIRQPFLQGGIGNGIKPWLDRWHKADYSDPASEWIPGKFPPIRISGYGGNEYLSTFWMENSAYYIRLKNVEVGYSLSETLLRIAGIEKLRLYLNLTNWLTFSNVNYVDPEAPYTGFTYPQTKNINMGLSVSF